MHMYKLLIYILLTIPPIVFFTDLTRNPYYFQIVFLNALTVFIWLWFLYKAILSGKLSIKTSSLDITILVFFVVATLSWLFNLYENFSNVYLRYSSFSEGLKRWLFLVTNAILVYYIPLNFLEDESFRKKTFNVLFFVGFIAALYGIFQFLGIEFIWPQKLNPFGGRSVSTFGNPNFLSSYIVILLPICLGYFLSATKSSATVLYFIYIITYITSLIVTLTRSSWLGATAALVIFFIFVDKKILIQKKQRLVYLGIFAAILLLFWPHPKSSEKYTPAILERLLETAQLGKQKLYGPVHQRLLIWSCAWHMVVDRPVIGRGWGLFELFYPWEQGKHLFLERFRLRTHANNTHNEILEIWSQTGTIGLGVYIWFLVMLFYLGYHIWKGSSGNQKILVLSVIGGIAGMLVDNLLNVSLHFAVPAFLYWWMVGFLMSCGGLKTKTIALNSIFSKVIVVCVITCGGVLIVRYYRNFLGEINYFAGFKLSKRGDVANALPYLERAHRFQRFEVNNNYELGNTYARLNMKEKAIWAYQEALKANAGYDEIFFNMATVYNQIGDVQNAIKNYTEALKINPTSFDAYMALGSIFVSQNSIESAIKLFNQALHFFPDNKDLLNNIGYFYTRVGQTDKAIELYKKALEIDPEFEFARKNLNTLLSSKGITYTSEYDRMMTQLENLIGKQRWQEALKTSQSIIEKYPKSFKARFYLANLYFTLGDFEKSEKIYKELLQQQPQNVTLLTNLAMVYEKQRRISEARDIWTSIKRIDPSNSLATEKLR